MTEDSMETTLIIIIEDFSKPIILLKTNENKEVCTIIRLKYQIVDSNM